MTEERKFYPGDQVRYIERSMRRGTTYHGSLVMGAVYIVGSGWRPDIYGSDCQDIGVVGNDYWQAAESFELVQRDNSLSLMSDAVVTFAKSKPKLEMRKCA